MPRNAVLGTAPIATGRSQSVFQNTRVVNQDGVGSYTWKPMGTFELRTTGGFNFTSQRVRTTSATANGLAPVGDLVSAGSVFSAGADRRRAPDARLLRPAGSRVGNDRLFLTAAVRYDASSTFAPSRALAGVPEVLGVVRRDGEPARAA